MYKKFLWIIILASTVTFSQLALADSWCRDGLKTIVSSLKLDDAQKAKIQPILDQLKSGMKDNWSQMNDLDTQIDQQANSATVNQDAINSLVDKKTRLIGNMMKAKIMAKNQILAILTAEQKMELQNKMKKAEEKIASKFKSCHSDE